MSGVLKRWIARKLCPEVFVDAERWHYARGQLDDLDKWCSRDVPAVGKAAQWVLRSVWVHFMPLEEFSRLTLDQHMKRPEAIDGFRRELRRDAGLDEIFPHRPVSLAPSAAEART